MSIESQRRRRRTRAAVLGLVSFAALLALWAVYQPVVGQPWAIPAALVTWTATATALGYSLKRAKEPA